MNVGTADLLVRALRRALPLLAILVALGATAVVAKRQVDGPRYSATAQVFLSTTDLGAVLAGVQPSYVDPRRVMENALSLARSPELYERAAENSTLTGRQLRSMVTPSGSDSADLISFTAVSDDRGDAVEAANAVGAAYPGWRAEVGAAAVRQAISQLRRQLPQADDREALEQQLQRLELMETLSSGNAMLLQPATGAAQLGPNPVRDALLGGAIGLVVALLLAGVREVLDTRIRSDGEAEELLKAPVLASIGRLPKRARLVTIGRHAERYGDAYALLAANVIRFRQTGETTVVAVTSATKEEGKTTTVSNLAVALAQRGLRVVLADFDVRRPSLAPIFKLPTVAPGVIQVVRDGLSLAAALQTISLNGDARPPLGRRGLAARRTSADGQTPPGSLFVLPAGGSIKGTLSHSPRVGDLLEALSDRADVVLVDTPPALSTPEMAELSNLVDLVLVVVRQGGATRRSLRALERQAQGWHTPVTGIVMTHSVADDSYSYYSS